jgi:hypothetical protein
MRALIIGPVEEAKIATLKALAETNVHDAKADMDAVPGAVRDGNARQTIALPIGFSVTYTLERQPIGLCRHLSVSVDKRGHVPSPEAVTMILEAFGMSPWEEALNIWVENFGRGEKAINVIELSAEAGRA